MIDTKSPQDYVVFRILSVHYVAAGMSGDLWLKKVRTSCMDHLPNELTSAEAGRVQGKHAARERKGRQNDWP